MFEKLMEYLKQNGCRVTERVDEIVANNKEKNLKIDIYKNTKEVYIYDTLSGNCIKQAVLN